MVQNANSVVAHADFVLVGEHECHAGKHLAVVLYDAVCFAAHVSSGTFDGGEGKGNLFKNGHIYKFS